MIVKPTVTELLKKAKNRYELVIATSKRARQIAMGDEPLTKVKEESPVTLAANEIAEGKVTIVREGEQPENKEENQAESEDESKEEDKAENKDKKEKSKNKKESKDNSKDKNK